MIKNTVAQIEDAEDQLRQAMLASDVESLDALISKDLIFTTHHGAVISKQDDLAVYRSGSLKFHAIELSEQRILVLNHIALVSVRAKLTGAFGTLSFQDDIRFSRAWQQGLGSTWQVVAGQATVVQSQ